MPLAYETLTKLRANHSALRFLAADHMPLMASFFHFTFIATNRRSIPMQDLAASLDDYLRTLRKNYGSENYTRTGRDYLEDWAKPESGHLRKYYVQRKDEPECDLTSETEKALEWLVSLIQPKAFVGTESRLMTFFDLLRELVFQTDSNPSSQIEALEKEKADIELRLEKAKAGFVEKLSPTLVKERFYQIEEIARHLLADFRQIEANFRTLDRQTRELIATSESTKGKLLDEVFTDQDMIWDSDQGRSFRGFWEFLLSSERQEELESLLNSLYGRNEIQEISPDPFLSHIKLFLLENGEKVYRTSSLLTEQFRKFLDDKTHLENRRIMDLVRSIEKLAIEIKDKLPSERHFVSLNSLAPDLDLAMGRGLFVPAIHPVINSDQLAEEKLDISLSSLYSQMYVDKRRLIDNIRKMLRSSAQVSLKKVIEDFPIQNGLAEIVGYLAIANCEIPALIEETITEEINYIKPAHSQNRSVNLPQVIYIREI